MNDKFAERCEDQEAKNKLMELVNIGAPNLWGHFKDGWFEKGRCTLPLIVECWRKSDCCWVEVNLATITCW